MVISYLFCTFLGRCSQNMWELQQQQEEITGPPHLVLQLQRTNCCCNCTPWYLHRIIMENTALKYFTWQCFYIYSVVCGTKYIFTFCSRFRCNKCSTCGQKSDDLRGDVVWIYKGSKLEGVCTWPAHMLSNLHLISYWGGITGLDCRYIQQLLEDCKCNPGLS